MAIRSTITPPLTRAAVVALILAAACGHPERSDVTQPEPVLVQEPAAEEATVPDPREIVEPMPHNRIYVTAAGTKARELVSVDRTGQVSRVRSLPGSRVGEFCGYERCVAPLLVDTLRSRVAWIRAEGASAVLVVSEGIRVSELGPAAASGAIGLVGDRWAWTTPDGGVVLQDGSRVDLPEHTTFVGTDAGGNPCAASIGARPERGGGVRLYCRRAEGWIEQPRWAASGFHAFAGLVAGGAASWWSGNFKYDCGLRACGRVVPIDGVGSAWPTAGVAHAGNQAIGGGRAADGPPREGEKQISLSGVPLAIRSGPTEEAPTGPADLDSWTPIAMSPDGSLLLAGRLGSDRLSVLAVGEVVARAAGTQHTPIHAIPLSDRLEDVEAVDWR